MKSILKKLQDIQAEVTKLNKEGFNDFQKYKYLSEAQITELFKSLFDKHKVLFTHSSEITSMKEWLNHKGTQQILTNVKVSYKFICSETGETIEGFSSGQGVDSGDKGIYIAVTGAVKYIFMKNFQIPTGDDAEKSGKNDKEVYEQDDRQWLSEKDLALYVKRIQAQDFRELTADEFKKKIFDTYKMKKEYRAEIISQFESEFNKALNN